MAARQLGLEGRRNVNGEGNIRQRADGRWEGRAYVSRRTAGRSGAVSTVSLGMRFIGL